MLDLPLLAAYLVVASLSLSVLAFLLYLHDRHNPAIRLMAEVTCVLGAVSVAFALLLFMEMSLSTKTAFQARAHSYAEAQTVTHIEGQ
jgi:heme/copper-type cytochrome/quinol oxidase subunit 4